MTTFEIAKGELWHRCNGFFLETDDNEPVIFATKKVVLNMGFY